MDDNKRNTETGKMQRVRNERGGEKRKKEEKEKKNEGVRSSRVGNETEPCINAKKIKGEQRERKRERE